MKKSTAAVLLNAIGFIAGFLLEIIVAALSVLMACFFFEANRFGGGHFHFIGFSMVLGVFAFGMYLLISLYKRLKRRTGAKERTMFLYMNAVPLIIAVCMPVYSILLGIGARFIAAWLITPLLPTAVFAVYLAAARKIGSIKEKL